MEKYIEITNSAKVRGKLNFIGANNVEMSKTAWLKHSFYPNNGVVGVVIAETLCFEGPIYIVQCGQNLFVPILPDGVREISRAEYLNKYQNNMQIGKPNNEHIGAESDMDELLSSIEKMFNRK